MEVFVGIGSFLGGALVTAFGYTLLITDRLSTLKTRYDTHEKAGTQACPLHGDLSTRVSLAEADSHDIKRRLEKMEEQSHIP